MVQDCFLHRFIPRSANKREDPESGYRGTGAAMLVGVLAGVSPAGANCPVGTVVISGDGAGDQTVGSPEVKALDGWMYSGQLRQGGKQSSRS